MDAAEEAALKELPTTVDDLNAMIEDEEKAANAIHNNPAVIEQYNQRKKEIEQEETKLEEMQAAFQEKETRFRADKATWETTVDEAVEAMQGKFQKFMRELSAGGDVVLNKGGSLAAWGLEIWVRFRETASLEKLQASVQSGGERSVSTIMYVLTTYLMDVAMMMQDIIMNHSPLVTRYPCRVVVVKEAMHYSLTHS